MGPRTIAPFMTFARLLTALLLAAPLACVSVPQPRAAAPVARAVDAPRDAEDLRVMTFNIQSALRGLDGVADAIRSASPDLVALQEVDVGSTRAHGLDEPAELSRRTGLPYFKHFRTTDLFGGAYGVALLSRYPFEVQGQYALPVPAGTEPRTIAHVVLHLAGGREVSVYATHLTRRPFNSDVRMRQSVAILKLLAQDKRPKLLMGDMNDDPDSRAVRLFTRELTDAFASSGSGPAGTYPLPLFLPTLRIDYVLVDGAFSAHSSRVLRVGASDHYPVVADLHLKPLVTPQMQHASNDTAPVAPVVGAVH